MVQATLTGVSEARPKPVKVAADRVDLSFGSPIRSAWRLAAFLVVAMSIASLQLVMMAIGSRLANVLPMIYHRACCRLLGLVIEQRGTMTTARPTLFVSNHCSYLDISALGSIIPGSFVAKAEVANWPLFGFLSKLQRTVFVDRQRRTTHHQRDELARRLAAGDNLILFPEGTSSDGNRTLPFRSALFAVAESGPAAGDAPVLLTIQPVSIAYTRLNGIPIGRTFRPLFAWYGDMDLFGHLWRVLGLGRIIVVIEFHPTVTLAQFGSRKALSQHCGSAVSAGLVAAITGRSENVESAVGRRPSSGYT